MATINRDLQVVQRKSEFRFIYFEVRSETTCTHVSISAHHASQPVIAQLIVIAISRVYASFSTDIPGYDALINRTLLRCLLRDSKLMKFSCVSIFSDCLKIAIPKKTGMCVKHRVT